MTKIIFCNTDSKRRILQTLLNFDEDKDKAITFAEKKYKYAEKLTWYRKSDLETTRADIEYHLDNSRILAALLAVFGAVVLRWISLRVPEDLKAYIEVGFSVFLFVPSAFIFQRLFIGVTWLHVMKIAIARRSELDSATSSATSYEQTEHSTNSMETLSQ